MKKKLKVQQHKKEDAERAFWASIDLSKYYSEDDFAAVSFPNLKPSSRSVSIRIPEYLLVRLKERANELNVPYQTLIKQFIAKEILHK